VDVRRAIRALGPLELAKYPLEEALAGLVASFRTSGLAVSLTEDGDPARLGAEQELVVFRTVQEALVNVVRHSGADRAQVRLECAPDVRLTIADNGRGAPENVLGRGFGLTEIRRRARSQAGHLQVDGRNGVLLTLRLPSGGGR
jgi:signal transduction histidine kinase